MRTYSSHYEDIVLKGELCDWVFVHCALSTLYENGSDPANEMAIRAKKSQLQNYFTQTLLRHSCLALIITWLELWLFLIQSFDFLIWIFDNCLPEALTFLSGALNITCLELRLLLVWTFYFLNWNFDILIWRFDYYLPRALIYLFGTLTFFSGALIVTSMELWLLFVCLPGTLVFLINCLELDNYLTGALISLPVDLISYLDLW